MKHSVILVRDVIGFFQNEEGTISLCDANLGKVFGRNVRHETTLLLVISTKELPRSVPMKLTKLRNTHCYIATIGKWRLWKPQRHLLMSDNTQILDNLLNAFTNKTIYVTLT